MRILFLTNELGTGGAEKLTVSYALGMKRRGHQVGVAFSSLDSQAAPLLEAGIEHLPALNRRGSGRRRSRAGRDAFAVSSMSFTRT